MATELTGKKATILLRAEELFANLGLHGVSIRDIAEAARVPPTLVLYHFKTKEGLYQAVFESRARELNEIRETALRPLLDGKEQPDVESVLHALAKPWFDIRKVRGGVSYARLIAREVSDPDEGSRGIIAKTLDPIARRFFEALSRALPEVSRIQVHWAGHYFIAALLMMMANTGRIQRLSGKNCKVDKASEAQIVSFFASALRGLASEQEMKPQRTTLAVPPTRQLRRRNTTNGRL
jgi:AcrR family transcriptional regulator